MSLVTRTPRTPPAGAGPAGAPRLAGVLKGMVWSALAALTAVVVLGIWGDWGHLAGAFGHFSWSAVPIALGLTLLNATLRFGKWHYYVRRIGARPRLIDSALIFVAGFALSVTPGKSGEFLKAYLLSRRSEAPGWKAAPITLAERATDGFAVLILAGAGLAILWRNAVPLLLCIVGAVGGCLLLAAVGRAAGPGRAVRLPAAAGRWWARLSARPAVGRLLSRLRESGAGAAAILDPYSLVLAVGLGFISWGAESLALWNALAAFGLTPTLDLFGAALVALNAGTLAGAASLLPGGAGAAEATIAGILAQYASREVAAAATLLIRLCTLWFGALLGIGALFLLRDSLAPATGSVSAGPVERRRTPPGAPGATGAGGRSPVPDRLL